MKFYWDYTLWVREITDEETILSLLTKYMVAPKSDLFVDEGIGNVFYSEASNNFFVTPL